MKNCNSPVWGSLTLAPTNSTEGSKHGSIWKNHQPPTVFLHGAKNHKYWIAVRHYTRCQSTTNNRKFCTPLIVLLEFFCSALTQTVLTYTVTSTEYKGHLQLKCSTAEWHVKTTLSVSYVQLQAMGLIHGDACDNDIVTCRA